MGRRSAIWSRKGRGYYSTFNGVQTFLGHNLAEAERQYHLHKLNRAPQRPGQHSIHDLINLYLEWCKARVQKHELRAITFVNYRSTLGQWLQHVARIAPEASSAKSRKRG